MQANELGLYALIQNILSQSMVIEGRFAVLKANGKEMDTTNFGQIIQDALTGLVMQKKYPCALMLPPFETEVANDKGWSTYKLQIYFLCLDKRTGDQSVKSPDLETNLSMHTYQMDWKDMREVAGNFVQQFRNMTMNPEVMRSIREHGKGVEMYHRITGIGTDKANGVHLTYEVQVWNGYNCGVLNDYPNGLTITVADLNPHPLHKQ